LLLNTQNHQFNRLVGVDIIVYSLVSFWLQQLTLLDIGSWLQTKPLAVRSMISCPLSPFEKQPIREGNHMSISILLSTDCMEPAKRVPLVVNLDYGYRFTDHERIRRQLDLIVEDLPECPELFILSIGHARRPAMVDETRGLIGFGTTVDPCIQLEMGLI
jgi:hypothetical protein